MNVYRQTLCVLITFICCSYTSFGSAQPHEKIQFFSIYKLLSMKQEEFEPRLRVKLRGYFSSSYYTGIYPTRDDAKYSNFASAVPIYDDAKIDFSGCENRFIEITGFLGHQEDYGGVALYDMQELLLADTMLGDDEVIVEKSIEENCYFSIW